MKTGEQPDLHYIKRWGEEAGIGEYGILFLGFDDKKKSLQEPLSVALPRSCYSCGYLVS